MLPARIDHLVVTAYSLEAGARFIRQALGVEPQVGGEHPRMGTHNLLVRLGESRYLEVISPNLSMPRPPGRRWFDLDSLVPDSPPRLSAWVVRTGDIHTAVDACSEALGQIEGMSRGALTWAITIPADGRVPLGGVAPALIEWHVETPPAARLPDQGLSLVELDIFHAAPARISRLLASLNLVERISVCKLSAGRCPYLVAKIDTAQGVRQFSSP